MVSFRVVMTTVALAGFIAATVPVAAQQSGKAAHHSTHAKKRTYVRSHATPATPRGVSSSEQGMDRAGANSSGGGGGGY